MESCFMTKGIDLMVSLEKKLVKVTPFHILEPQLLFLGMLVISRFRGPRFSDYTTISSGTVLILLNSWCKLGNTTQIVGGNDQQIVLGTVVAT